MVFAVVSEVVDLSSDAWNVGIMEDALDVLFNVDDVSVGGVAIEPLPLYAAIDGWVAKYVYTSTFQSVGKSIDLWEQLRTPRAIICAVSAPVIAGSIICSVRTAISEMPFA